MVKKKLDPAALAEAFRNFQSSNECTNHFLLQIFIKNNNKLKYR